MNSGKNGMKSGNQMEASMYSGERLLKDNAVFEVLGTLDELDSFEREIKKEVVVPREFITPGKTLMSARIDLARYYD